MPNRFQTIEYDGDSCVIDIEKLSIRRTGDALPFAIFSTREQLADFLGLASDADLEPLREFGIRKRRERREISRGE